MRHKSDHYLPLQLGYVSEEKRAHCFLSPLFSSQNTVIFVVKHQIGKLPQLLRQEHCQEQGVLVSNLTSFS